MVTEIVPAGKFYSAEDYHQDYLQKNPGGYTCHYVRDSKAGCLVIPSGERRERR